MFTHWNSTLGREGLNPPGPKASLTRRRVDTRPAEAGTEDASLCVKFGNSGDTTGHVVRRCKCDTITKNSKSIKLKSRGAIARRGGAVDGVREPLERWQHVPSWGGVGGGCSSYLPPSVSRSIRTGHRRSDAARLSSAPSPCPHFSVFVQGATKPRWAFRVC